MHSREVLSEFSSHDLYLAAFLSASGLPLLRVERENGNRVNFVFAADQKTEELLSQFHNNGPIRVGDYRRCLGDLKTLIFNAGRCSY